MLQNLKGLQVSLGYNRVLGKVDGWQIGGLFNQVGGEVKGIQVSVGYNQNKQSMHGLQIGGVFNLIKEDYKGLQVSVGLNLVKKQLKGVQIGAINSAKKVQGLQVGLVNFADTSAGYSIGLLNIIRKGYHKLSMGTNESIDLNVALKTGTSKFYTQLLYGQNLRTNHQLIAIGFGLGREVQLGKQFSLSPALSTRYLYQGDWMYANLLNRVDLNLSYRVKSWLSVDAGPAFNIYYSKQTGSFENFEFLKPPQIGHKFRSWAGWNLGITLL